MNCDDIRTRLDAYHDGELEGRPDGEAAAMVTGHLADCPACTAILAERRSLGDYLRRHGSTAVPPALWRTIETHAAATMTVTRTGSWTTWLLPRLAAAGLGALLVGAAWVATRPGGPAPRLPEPVASYLRAPGRLLAAPAGTFHDLEQLRRRPEQLVLEWARTGGTKK